MDQVVFFNNKTKTVTAIPRQTELQGGMEAKRKARAAF